MEKSRVLGNYKRVFLTVLFSIAAIATLLCTLAMLTVSDYSLREMVMVTAVGTGYLVALTFGAFFGIDKPGIRWVAGSGIAISFLMMFALPVWAYLESQRMSWSPGMEWLSKAVGSGMVLAGAFCMSAFVFVPRLQWIGRFLQLITFIAIAGGALIFMLVIWVGPPAGDFVERLLMATLIVTGGGTALVWALSRWLGIKLPDPLTTLDQTLFIRCPRCSREQDLPMGESRCTACGLWFKIEMEEPKCAACGYNLRGLTHALCPECGRPITKELLGTATTMM